MASTSEGDMKVKGKYVGDRISEPLFGDDLAVPDFWFCLFNPQSKI